MIKMYHKHIQIIIINKISIYYTSYLILDINSTNFIIYGTYYKYKPFTNKNDRMTIVYTLYTQHSIAL